MKANYLRAGLIILAFGLVSTGSLAADETIYGSQLMTRQERMEHRNAMRNLKTDEERNAYRLEHHRKMQERAAERGVKLPDAPPARGMGMGPGPGMGQGMGMGPGGRP